MRELTVRVVSPDGGVAGSGLEAREWALQDAALRLLLAHPGFRRSAPGAVLVAVESHRGPPNAQGSRVCLQFEGPRAAPLRLWARWGRRNRVLLGRGVITVQPEVQDWVPGHPNADLHGTLTLPASSGGRAERG